MEKTRLSLVTGLVLSSRREETKVALCHERETKSPSWRERETKTGFGLDI